MTTHTPLLAEGRGTVRVTYHQFHVTVDKEPMLVPPPLDNSNGLVVPGPGGFMVILTGIHTGVVSVAVEAHADRPALDLNVAEEIVEVSAGAAPQVAGDPLMSFSEIPFEERTAEMRIAALDGGPSDLPVLNPGGPGHYPVRVHASHRGHNWDGVDFDPVEEYLIQVWPDSPATEALYKLSDNPHLNPRLR